MLLDSVSVNYPPFTGQDFFSEPTWPGWQLGPVVRRVIDEVTKALVSFIFTVEFKITAFFKWDTEAIGASELILSAGRKSQQSVSWWVSTDLLLLDVIRKKVDGNAYSVTFIERGIL